MKIFINKNNNYHRLILGIAIPVLGIFVFAIFIYICFLFIKPKLNFLYIAGNNNICLSAYSVREGRLHEGPYPKPDNLGVCHGKAAPSFFVYESSTNISKKISLVEAENLYLNDQPKSPDGYQVVSKSKYAPWPFSLFFKSSNNGYFLEGPTIMKRLYYGNNRMVVFIGWINY
jgi:hypothetical protein